MLEIKNLPNTIRKTTFDPDPTKIHSLKIVPDMYIEKAEILTMKKMELNNSEDLYKYIQQSNKNQNILNDHFMSGVEFVMVIQVHNRTTYLNVLINSLVYVYKIHKTLLIFSHDLYLEENNILIRSIKFAPILQIFFPYNTQVFHDQFPDSSKTDCKFNQNFRKNLSNCTNLFWFDSYGNYRNAKLSQIKHHWNWKINFVFESIRVLKNYSRRIIFIEEDNFVVEDVLYAFERIEEKAKSHNDVEIIVLGDANLKVIGIRKAKVFKAYWHPKYNVGLSFNRTFYTKLKLNLNKFCYYDDYNWDWSLCFALHKTKALIIGFMPRIYHIGQCGIHSKNTFCSPVMPYIKIKRIWIKQKNELYNMINLVEYFYIKLARIRKGYGGWSDKRDKQLCKIIMKGAKELEGIDIKTILSSNSYENLENYILSQISD